VARFTDLAITGTGAHTLRFSSTGLADVTATPVTVAAPTTMRLLVGATPTLAGTAGTDVVIPLGLDLQGRGTQNLAAITTTVTWDPAKYTFVAHGTGTWVDDNGDPATVTVNANNVATGTISISGYTNEGTTASGLVLRTITLRPVATGPVTVSATVTSAGNASGQTVTVVPRQLGEVAPPPTTPDIALLQVAPPFGTFVVGDTGSFDFRALAADNTTVVRPAGGFSVSASSNLLAGGATQCTATGCTQRFTVQNVASGQALRVVTMTVGHDLATAGSPRGTYTARVFSELDSMSLYGPGFTAGQPYTPAPVTVGSTETLYPYVFFIGGSGYAPARNAEYTLLTGTADLARCSHTLGPRQPQSNCIRVTPRAAGTVTVQARLRKPDGTFWTTTHSFTAR
jgi:hypothetical protein